jgi:hypothetical protein
VSTFLDRMSPLQRQLLMMGVPVVAALAVLRGRKPSPSTSSATGTTVAPIDTSAVDSGQLASFEDAWSNALYDVQQSIADLATSGVSSPSTPPSDPAPLSATQEQQLVAAQRVTVATVSPHGEVGALPVASATYSPSALDYTVASGKVAQTVVANPTSRTTSTIVQGPASLGTGPTVSASQRIDGERYVQLTDKAGKPTGRYRVIL